ncbi:trypsin-like peptidase domain-containing protein, partial [Streptomyces niveus]
YSAEVVGTDSSKDLALIKVQGAKGLKAASLGDSDKVAVGDDVVAIGSPAGLTGTAAETLGRTGLGADAPWGCPVGV